MNTEKYYLSQKAENKGLTTVIVKRAIKTLFLSLHFSTVVHQFYEIVFDVVDDDGYEILFRKIQRGLTAIVSLLSFIFYIWYSDLIQTTLLKLQQIDYAFKSIVVKEYRPPNGRTVYVLCSYVVLIILHFYTRYLRASHFNASNSFVVVMKDSFVRTYFLAVNAFIMLSFIKKIADGKNDLVRLNRHVNNQVDGGRTSIHVNESNELNRIYFQILEYCDSVRKYYQAPIFMILTSDMFTIIYMILIAFHEFVSKSIPTRAVLFCVVDPFIRIVQTVTVMSAAEAAVFQTHEWSNTLQRVMIEIEVDRNVKEKLKLFLMEMVDKKLIFVICGFFKLSHETLVAMMGTVSTYLLIMMQFQPLGDEEEDSKNTAKSKLF